MKLIFTVWTRSNDTTWKVWLSKKLFPELRFIWNFYEKVKYHNLECYQLCELSEEGWLITIWKKSSNWEIVHLLFYFLTYFRASNLFSLNNLLSSVDRCVIFLKMYPKQNNSTCFANFFFMWDPSEVELVWLLISVLLWNGF